MLGEPLPCRARRHSDGHEELQESRLAFRLKSEVKHKGNEAVVRHDLHLLEQRGYTLVDNGYWLGGVFNSGHEAQGCRALTPHLHLEIKAESVLCVPNVPSIKMLCESRTSH